MTLPGPRERSAGERERESKDISYLSITLQCGQSSEREEIDSEREREREAIIFL